MARPKEVDFYGLAALGYAESLPMSGDYHRDQLAVERLCFRIGHKPEEGGLGKFEHYRRFIDLIYNREGSYKQFIWHPWSEWATRKFCEELEVGAAGSASCVAGHTRLLDPTTGETPTIQELCDRGDRPWVQTLNGPILAEVPFLKGRAELFEFRLTNGGRFTCTAEHRLLTPRGWLHACDVRCGEPLFGYSSSPASSISGSDQSVRASDAARCTRTLGGSQSSYSACSRPCGELLRRAQDTARGVLPSPSGAPEHTGCGSSDGGDPAPKQARNRLCLQNDLPAKRSGRVRTWMSGTLSSLLSLAGTFSRPPLWSRLPALSQPGSTPAHTSPGPSPRGRDKRNKGNAGPLSPESGFPACSTPTPPFSRTDPSGRPQGGCSRVPETDEQLRRSSLSSSPAFDVFSSSGLMVELPLVVSIDNLGVGDFYDLHVPGEEHYFAEGAIHHNSGKTNPAAMWAVGNYLADPTHTKVFCFSTTIKESKDRIWKEVVEFWNAAPGADGKAGKLNASLNQILGLNYSGKGFGTSSGIYLYAADKSNESTAYNSLIGSKVPKTGQPVEDADALLRDPEFADLAHMGFEEEGLKELVLGLQNISVNRRGRIIIIIDEATGVSEKLLDAYFTNLKPGNEGKVQIIVIGNPSSRFDTHGKFCEPDAGWASINEGMDEWRTATGGVCLHFDGRKNPRIVNKDERLIWMPTEKANAGLAEKYGENSYEYYRMVIGFWSPAGASNTIYSEADFMRSGALSREPVIWRGGYGDHPTVTLCGFDPAFTMGGDRAVAWFARLGIDQTGLQVLEAVEEVSIKPDISKKDVPVAEQILLKWRYECQKRNVPPENCCFDSSGGGVSFAALVHRLWSPKVRAVSSGGKASSKPLRAEKDPSGKPIRGCDKYANRATELWCVNVPFLRTGQLKGIPNDLAKELCSRQTAKKKGVSNLDKIQIEKKGDYKDRERQSPDSGDGWNLTVDEAITRHGFRPSDRPAEGADDPQAQRPANSPWEQLKRRARKISNRKQLKRS